MTTRPYATPPSSLGSIAWSPGKLFCTPIVAGILDDTAGAQCHAFAEWRQEMHPLPLDNPVLATPRDVLIGDVSRSAPCPAKAISICCDAETHATSEEQLAPTRKPGGSAVLATPRGSKLTSFHIALCEHTCGTDGVQTDALLNHRSEPLPMATRSSRRGNAM